MEKPMFKIAEYVPEGPPVTLDLHGFWLVPDPSRPSGHRSVPIPHEQFMAYLDSLDD